MAIAFDAVSSNQGSDFSSSSFSHTCTGSNRYLVVIVNWTGNNSSSIAVTYSGVAMTLLATATINDRSATKLFGLAAPASGVNTVAVSGNGNGYFMTGAISLTGVLQTNSVDTTGTNTSSGDITSLAATLTTSYNNSLIVFAVGKRAHGSPVDDQTFSITSPGTLRYTLTQSGFAIPSAKGATQTTTTPGSQTIQTDITPAFANTDTSMAGVAIRPLQDLPAAPTAPSAASDYKTINLSWTAPADPTDAPVTDYKIYRSTSAGTEVYFATSSGTGTTYSDTTAANINGQTYYYKILAVNSVGDGALSSEVSATFRRWKNPANAYADDGSYATASSANGNISVQLSKDGGSNYNNVITNTFTGTETTQTYGATTELWGSTWTGDDVDNTSFKLKIYCNEANNYQEYKTFGFAITASYILTGIQVQINGKWDSGTNISSIDLVTVKIYYGTSVVPVVAGSQSYASNGRKNGEGVGVGTGVLVFYDSTSKWIACDTGQEVAA